MSTAPPAPVRETRHTLLLWTGVLAGPVAWLLQLEGVYALAMGACARDSVFALHLASLACLLAAAGGMWVAWRSWRTVRGWPSDWDEGLVARTRFLSVLGLLTGTLFSVVILAQWIAVALLDPCPV